MTVRGFMEQFLRYREASGTIEPSTVRSYRGEAKQIYPALGAVRLAELTSADIDRWMAGMTVEGYAPKTVAKPFRLLKQALKWAVGQDLLAKNACAFCKPPKRAKTPINALSREDRSRMLALAREAIGQPLGLAIELAPTTGMRRGEVCALRWSDLNDDGSITVSYALGNGGAASTSRSRRRATRPGRIPLTKSTFARRQAWRRGALQQVCEFGYGLGDAFILGTQEPDSRPYNTTMLGKDFAAFCKMNGFSCTFHDLRHAFATMMIAGGCDVRTVASYLRHASVSMTLDIYADVDPDAKAAAVSKVEDSFDLDGYGPARIPDEGPGRPPKAPEPAISFTVGQLEAMLAAAKAKEAGREGA